ncbi:MAG: hypothetical protein ACI4AM_02720 [Muribaculaceae bacterium]
MKKFLIIGGALAAVMLIIFGINGCGGGSKSHAWPHSLITADYNDSTVSTKPTKVSIVIENSGSMASYYSTDYKSMLNTIVSFKNISDNSQLFIGNAKEPSKGFVDDVINQMVHRHNFTTTTKIHEFLDSALRQVNGGTDMVCFVTDGIMSVDNGDMSFKLGELEATIKKLFGNSKDVAAAVLRYKGNFKGGYWTATGAKVTLPECERPYYVIVVGKPGTLQWLSEQPKSDFNNYDAALFMGMFNYTKYNTLEIKSKTFDAVNIASSEKVSISIDYTKNRCLSFLATNGILKAESIELYDDVKGEPVNADWYTVALKDGRIVVTINDNKTVLQMCGGKTELQLSVRMPNTLSGSWTGTYSTDDDSKILVTVGNKKSVDSTTTFGLANLVRGMYKGLQSEEYVFNIHVKFNR